METASNSAQVITAVATLITAFALLVTAFVGIIPLLKRTKAIQKSVDGHTTSLLAYQATLTRALKAAGVDVPEDQSAGGE